MFQDLRHQQIRHQRTVTIEWVCVVSMFGSFAVAGASRNYFRIIVRLHLNHDVFLCERFYKDISCFFHFKINVDHCFKCRMLDVLDFGFKSWRAFDHNDFDDCLASPNFARILKMNAH